MDRAHVNQHVFWVINAANGANRVQLEHTAARMYVEIDDLVVALSLSTCTWQLITVTPVRYKKEVVLGKKG